VVVHIGFNLDGLAAVCEQVLLNNKLNATSLKLVETISQFSKEHFFAVLLQKVEVTVLARKEHCSKDFEKVL